MDSPSPINPNKPYATSPIGFVQTRYVTFEEGLTLECGEVLAPLTLAYETYGALNEDKTNAIVIEHALTGDSHVAGIYTNQDKKPGWWEDMVGPDKAFDTNKYFVICSNILGGCKGSTGPSSINPKTNKPYGLSFPAITISDMVNAQIKLLDYLGISKVLSVAGGSMGGMQALDWFILHPERIHSVIPIATTVIHSPQQIAFNEVGRQAIMSDPEWNEGNYYETGQPAKGLAVARMLGHITYMSDASMKEKFGRETRKADKPFKFTAEFEVESYLHYNGGTFVNRFDANTYLYITKAMDMYDPTGGKKLAEVLKGNPAKLLVISFESDWLYPTYQSLDIIRACKAAGVDVSFMEIESTYGHDAFLIEFDDQARLIKNFLKRVTEMSRKGDGYEI